MIPSFNLVDEPWVPVVFADSRRYAELSLRDFFTHAHELVDMAGETPLVDAAFLRFALAVLYAVYREQGMSTKGLWQGLWQRKQFDMQMIEGYLRRPSIYERFDLFHETYPFYQLPRHKITKEAFQSPLKIVMHFAAGNNPTLFDHHMTVRPFALSPAEAARHLITVMTFASGGGIGKRLVEGADGNFRNAPWGKGIVFMARGKNLFETLMLNWITVEQVPEVFYPADKDLSDHVADDLPWWERKEGYRREKEARGYLNYLTWPSRWVYLEPSPEDGYVRRMMFSPGLGVPSVFIEQDPFLYHNAENQPRSFTADRVLWRDSETLLSMPRQQKAKGAKSDTLGLLNWLDGLFGKYLKELEGEKRLRQARYDLMATGMTKGKSRFDFVRVEYFPLTPLLSVEEAQEVFKLLGRAIRYAERVGTALRYAVQKMAQTLTERESAADGSQGGGSGGGVNPTGTGGQRGKKKSAWELLRDHWRAEHLYWSALTPYFYALVDTCVRYVQGEVEDVVEAEEDWYRYVKRQGAGVLQDVAGTLAFSPRALRAQVEGLATFERVLRTPSAANAPEEA